MFCYQCEQTAKGEGCTVKGVCGKEHETAGLQDLLIHLLRGISRYAHRARQLGSRDHELDVFMVKALFATLTNVNFDPGRFEELIREASQGLEKAEKLYTEACARSGKKPEDLGGEKGLAKATRGELVARGERVGVAGRKEKLGADVTGLQELITYGLKGLAAYADHAQIQGQEDDSVYAFIYETLDFLSEPAPAVDKLLGWALRVGEVNLRVMELLDAANTGTYGHPEPTRLRITPKKGKALLVSGHDLKDLEEILRQTEGQGINVYTHGEMLPCHAYPGLKKYPHLVGNYGSAWQNQVREFDEFPGAILMTTNCLQKPRESYQDRIFTTGNVGWPGVKHIHDRNFGPVIEAALKAPGFAADGEEKYITIGFARQTVLAAADQVIAAVKGGKIRHFFLIGGCDGAKAGRNYYTEFAQSVPADCVILTLGCGKYRFHKLEFGQINGLPRLLDAGQCNDAYSAIQIALALANAFNTDVNNLPLSLVLCWFEQKAVAILLTLLHLGIKNIRLGPSLPAFVTPAALEVLTEKFNLAPISTPAEDLKAILG